MEDQNMKRKMAAISLVVMLTCLTLGTVVATDYVPIYCHVCKRETAHRLLCLGRDYGASYNMLCTKGLPCQNYHYERHYTDAECETCGNPTYGYSHHNYAELHDYTPHNVFFNCPGFFAR